MIVNKEGLVDATPERLFEAVTLACLHENDEFYSRFVNGVVYLGPFAKRSEITLHEYLWLKRECEIAEAGRIAKRKHTSVRRSDFNANRHRLALAMLDAGVPNKCAYVGCDVSQDLTVDHIIPLSRGGDDDLANLQFLCRSHNSSKGDRLDHKPEQ